MIVIFSDVGSADDGRRTRGMARARSPVDARMFDETYDGVEEDGREDGDGGGGARRDDFGCGALRTRSRRCARDSWTSASGSDDGKSCAIEE